MAWKISIPILYILKNPVNPVQFPFLSPRL